MFCFGILTAGTFLVFRVLRGVAGSHRLFVPWCGDARGRQCAGRADYFGNLPNLAARVSALAAPGQVLLEGSGLGMESMSQPAREDSVVVLPPLSGMPPPPPAENSDVVLLASDE